MIRLILYILLYFYLSIGAIIGIRLAPFKHVVAIIIYVIFQCLLWLPNIIADVIVNSVDSDV